MGPARAAMDLAAVILAAGKGTRMRSSLPKVLHPLLGRPIISYVLDLASQIGAGRIILVLGHKWKEVADVVQGSGAEIVVQEPQLGTAHAVQQASPLLHDFEGDVLVLAGDSPLLTPSTLSRLVDEHRHSGAAATVLTAWAEDPTGCGRIILDERDQFLRIVEEKDADDQTRAIRRVNTSTYVFRAPLLFQALGKVRNDNVQREYYLTDALGILRGEGHKVHTTVADSFEETLGINTVAHLKRAETVLRTRSIGQGKGKLETGDAGNSQFGL